MGKYSLENYSPYASEIIRPKPTKQSYENIGGGTITYLRYSWDELEQERGVYQLTVLKEEIKKTLNPVLILEANPPQWMKGSLVKCFSRLIRRVGSSLKEEQYLAGVIITSLNHCVEVWDSYIDAFEETPIIADLMDRELITYLKSKKVTFGLAVRCKESNWIEVCEKFARDGLQKTWESAPVLLQLEDEVGENVVRESMRWHAAYADFAIDIGYKYALRRVTYPKKSSTKGALPIRYWFVNNGSAPCYIPFTLKIKLKKGTLEYILPLKISSDLWRPGDITHNEILQLPSIEPGTYSLSTGIFFDQDKWMKLTIDAEDERGFYYLGELEVDSEDRDEMYEIWNHFYPEGYYPLEDPKVPS